MGCYMILKVITLIPPTTQLGCDSIVTLSLFVTDAEITFKNETICSNVYSVSVVKN